MGHTLWIIATLWLGCLALVLEMAERAPTLDEDGIDLGPPRPAGSPAPRLAQGFAASDL